MASSFRSTPLIGKKRSPSYQRLRSVLVQARTEAGLTQAQVATALKRPQSFVSKYESGERNLDVVEFISVCSVLGIRPAAVLKAVAGAG